MSEDHAPLGVTMTPGASPIQAGAPAQRAQEWYETYGKAVYTYLRFHLPSADIAEDVAADTFLKVFRAADKFDEAKGQPRTWIFRIAQNTLRDHQRRTRVRRHVSLTSMRDLVAEGPSPEERLLWEEQVSRLLAAVTGLSDADREIISLRYGSGLDSPAVAEVLGIKESAARTRLWRALARLRTELDRGE